MSRPQMRISAVVLGAPDARALAAFYTRLLGWPVVESEPGWVRLRPPGDSVSAGISIAHEPDFVAPVWPSVAGAQQMMAHLDIEVDDLEAAVAWAQNAGAILAEHQPQARVRVMLDPARHPFCIFEGSR